MQILIACGLRLKDARTLPLDCVTRDSAGAPYLAWLNRKMNDRAAFFPISESLAGQIAGQQQRVRAAYPESPWLFPARQANLDGRRHTSDGQFRAELATWLERVELADEHGIPARVTSHQFRHTVATRLKRRGVASDATFRNLRQDGAVRDAGPGATGRRSRREGEPAGQAAVTGQCCARCRDVARSLVASGASMM